MAGGLLALGIAIARRAVLFYPFWEFAEKIYFTRTFRDNLEAGDSFRNVTLYEIRRLRASARGLPFKCKRYSARIHSLFSKSPNFVQRDTKIHNLVALHLAPTVKHNVAFMYYIP